jgi:hypothetical protein
MKKVLLTLVMSLAIVSFSQYAFSQDSIKTKKHHPKTMKAPADTTKTKKPKKAA